MTSLTAALGYQFDANEVQVTEYTPIPEGEYIAMITAASLDDTKSGGKMLTFDFTVQGSNYDGRVLKERANIVNSNATAQKIGHETLAKICKAVGISQPRDTNEFLNKRVKVKVGVEKGVGTYINKAGEEKPKSDQNVLKGFYPITGAPVQTTAAPAPTAQPAATVVPPWAQR